MSIPTQNHIINGEFVSPSSGQYLDLIDPVMGQVIGKAAAGNSADVDRAVAAASEAFKSLKNTATSERANIQDSEVKALANDIIKAQKREIDEMKQMIERLEKEK